MTEPVDLDGTDAFVRRGGRLTPGQAAALIAYCRELRDLAAGLEAMVPDDKLGRIAAICGEPGWTT